MLFHHRLKRLTLSVQVTLENEQNLQASNDERASKLQSELAQQQREVVDAAQATQKLDDEVVQRHKQMHDLTRLGALLSESVKDAALDLEEARSAAEKVGTVVCRSPLSTWSLIGGEINHRRP